MLCDLRSTNCGSMDINILGEAQAVLNKRHVPSLCTVNLHTVDEPVGIIELAAIREGIGQCAGAAVLPEGRTRPISHEGGVDAK